MDILKTPHQKLLEEAGATPASPGMVHTPKQMLMQESGIMPRFAGGGNVSGLPNVSFDARSIPNMTGTPGIGYEQGVQGATARMQLEKELKNRARLRAGISGMGMAIPGQQGVKMMPGEMDIGAKFPVGPGNLDISARRSINPIPGRGYNQGINAQYSMPFANGGAVQMSPEDMMAELIYGGQTPQRFATGGQPKQMSPEFEAILNKLYKQQIFSGELPPEPTFQAQPVTLTSRARDAAASVLGDLPADRLFGTGSEGQKSEYLPLQFLNPISATTETISAVPETARQLRQGDMMGAGITAGATGLGVLPFLKPIKSAIKKLKPKK